MKLHKHDVIAKYSYHFDAKLSKDAKRFDSVGKWIRSLHDSPEEMKLGKDANSKLSTSINRNKSKTLGKDHAEINIMVAVRTRPLN